MRSYHRWSKVREHRQAPGIAESLVGGSNFEWRFRHFCLERYSETECASFFAARSTFRRQIGLMSKRGPSMFRMRRKTTAGERDERWPAPRSPFCLAMGTAAILLSVVASGCKNLFAPGAPNAVPPIPTVTVATVVQKDVPIYEKGNWYYGRIRQRSNTAESVRLSG